MPVPDAPCFFQWRCIAAEIAAFDFDGTCISGNSPVILVSHLVRKGLLGKGTLLRILCWAAAYKLRLPQNESWVRGAVFSAFEGNADIAVGNAVGSVTANTGLIMCLSLICMECTMPRRQYAVKAVLLLAAIAVLFGFTRDGQLSILESVLILVIFEIGRAHV